MTNAFKALSDATAAIVDGVAANLVSVHGRAWGGSSGIVVKPGIAVTAEEALDKDDDIEITRPDGKRVPATLVGRDSSTDVAVLRFEGGGPTTPIVAAQPKTGSLMIAVGRGPSGPLAALGMVAFVGDAWRSSEGGEIDAMIRLNVNLPRPSEGGALVDADGALIGMAAFGPRRRVIAIPTATVLRSVDRIVEHGTVVRGYVGVGVQPVEAGGEGKRAAMVVGLDDDGPAKRAGLLLGDILMTWNGEPIAGARGLVSRLGPDSVGKTIEIGVVRAGKEAKVSVVVAGRPAA